MSDRWIVDVESIWSSSTVLMLNRRRRFIRIVCKKNKC